MTLPAGNFSEWLRDMRRALAGGPGMDVACGDCVGCCTSSYFIKIRPRETRALAAVDAKFLTDTPGRDGAKLMGYRENGHCPMYGATGCSIYRDRPDTCRTYDCRVFTAAGMAAGDDKPVINERVARWRFEYPTETDHREQAAVRAAASFLRQHPVRFPGGHVPSRASEIAVLAVKSYEVFMTGGREHRDTERALVETAVAFDAAAG
ncbi:MAG TPA: YkgJ family cysteine cluster protein [Steroidobacteraceae bacterium]|nr:YkgJ family cysteine cluster protein [Steroidobacteraceae bacterium]